MLAIIRSLSSVGVERRRRNSEGRIILDRLVEATKHESCEMTARQVRRGKQGRAALTSDLPFNLPMRLYPGTCCPLACGRSYRPVNMYN